MIPADFPQSNCSFSAPDGLAESQVMSIPAYRHRVLGGSVDGCTQVVVAWLPTPAELELLNQGKPIFLSMIGGLLPHYLSMDFHSAIHPA